MQNEGNGEGSVSEYEELLQELNSGKVPLADAEKIASEGINLFNLAPTRQPQAAILVTVPNAERFYGKNEQIQALLLNMLSHTIITRKEHIYLQAYMRWCDNYTGDYTRVLRYLAGKLSENGISRQQYIDAITSMRIRNYGNNGNRNNKPKYQEGKLP